MTAVRPRASINAVVRPPGSKSITNRALVVAALAGGESRLVGALESRDTAAMVRAVRAAKVGVSREGSDIVVEGRGGVLGESGSDETAVFVGDSGTTARFATAMLTLADSPHLLDGSPRMRQRPMGGLVDVLSRLGARVEAEGAEGGLPIRVAGGGLEGGSATVDARFTGQFVSAVALAGPGAKTPISLDFVENRVASAAYVNGTIEIMAAFGVKARFDGKSLRIRGPQRYAPQRFVVEPDASAAVYPWVAAAITGGAATVVGLWESSSQPDLAILEVLRRMGCTVTANSTGTRVEGPAALLGVDADLSHMPDGALAVAVAASFARHPSRLGGLTTLRVKESDRLEALAAELSRLGANVEAQGDSLMIESPAHRGARVQTYNDHRMAMSFALAGLRLEGVEIENPQCVGKTWPGFFEELDRW